MADFTFNEAVEVVRLCDQAAQFLAPAKMTEYIVAGYALAATSADAEALLRYEFPHADAESAVWDAIDLIAREHLRTGVPMPPELAQWMADRREGKRQRPAKPGPSRGTNMVRDRLIASVVQALVDRGFRATRNKRLPMKMARPRASAEGGSACDAVGVALGMGYKAVEKVWTNSDPSARELLRGSLNDIFASYEMQRNK